MFFEKRAGFLLGPVLSIIEQRFESYSLLCREFLSEPVLEIRFVRVEQNATAHERLLLLCTAVGQRKNRQLTGKVRGMQLVCRCNGPGGCELRGPIHHCCKCCDDIDG